MTTKATRNRQAQKDALLNLLRQRRQERRPAPSVGELAAALGVSRTTVAGYIDDLERTQQIKVRRNEQSRIISRTIVLADWMPE